MRNFFKKISKTKLPTECLGLDIGTHTIKFVSLKREAGDWFLDKLTMEEISSESLLGLAPSVKEELTIQALTKVLSRIQLDTKDVVISVSGEDVIVRYLTMPKMNEKELASSIRFQAQGDIPFDLEQAIIDFQVIGENVSDKNKIDIFLIAAKKELVTRQIKLLEAVGLSVSVVDVDNFALQAGYEFNHDLKQEKDSLALINIGATYTNINIFKNRIPYFVRDIPIAGNNITKAIQRDMKMGYPEAENLKKTKGLVRREEEQTPSEGQLLELTETIRSTVGDLVEELVRSFEFYQSQEGPDWTVSKIILAGGTGKLKGLDKFISQKLGIPVELANPFLRLKNPPDSSPKEDMVKTAPFFAVAVGLGLRS